MSVTARIEEKTSARESMPAAGTQTVSSVALMAFPLWFPAFRWLARTIPPDVLGRIATPTVERAAWSRCHEAILGNTARILGLSPSHPRVEETARAMLASHSRLWIDLIRCASLEPAKVRGLVARHEGTEHLLAARAAGHGAVLLTAHVGNFELGGLFLKELGIEVAAVYQPDPSPAVERHRARARAEMGVRGIPVTSSPLSFVTVIRALEANAFVAIQGDRDYSGTGMRVPFFGVDVSFPVGPFKIAAAAGAPVLPVFILQEPDGRYRTLVEPPIRVAEPARRAERGEATREALSRFVAILERTIRENPAQFYLFSPLAGG